MLRSSFSGSWAGRAVACAGVLALLAGCVGSGNEPVISGSDRTANGHKIEPAAAGHHVEYRLGSGDKLRVIRNDGLVR